MKTNDKVVQLYNTGMKAKQISEILGITISTVKKYLPKKSDISQLARSKGITVLTENASAMGDDLIEKNSVRILTTPEECVFNCNGDLKNGEESD